MGGQQEHLAFLLPDLSGGGAQRVVLNLVNGICARGYRVDLLLVSARGPYLEEVHDSVRIVDLKASRSLSTLLPLVRYLRSERPTVLLSAVEHINLVALCARWLSGTSTRVVVSVHSVLSDLTHYAPSRRGRLLPYLTRSYRWADAIVAVSYGVENDLLAKGGLPRQRMRVIYNPVVTPELQQKAKRAVEHPWFAPGEPPVILAVGRLSASKDFATLLRAFQRVRSTRLVRLMILGEGEERFSLEALINQLHLEQDVSLPGFVENPYAYMSRASLFVLSSRSEALPTVLIEAMYCGLPLVSTSCPGGAREILADGKYGRLVPVGDIEALASAIALGLAEGATTNYEAGWRPFETDNSINRYLQVLLGET